MRVWMGINEYYDRNHDAFDTSTYGRHSNLVSNAQISVSQIPFLIINSLAGYTSVSMEITEKEIRKEK